MMFVLGPLLHNVAAMSGAGGGAFTPASLSGINIWLENDAATVLNTGTTPATDLQTAYKWTGKQGGKNVDDGGNGVSFQPIWHANGGTKGWLQFDAVNDYLQSSATTATTDASGNYTLGASGYFDSVGSNQPIIVITDASLNQIGFIRVLTGGAMQAIAADSGLGVHGASGATISAATWYTFIMRMNATAGTLDVWVDGVVGTQVTGLTSMAVVTSAAYLMVPKQSGGTGGRIAGVVHTTAANSDADIANLHTYLAALHP